MQPKALLPKLWRRTPADDTPAKPKSTEDSVNKPSHPVAAAPAPKTDMLSYDDIYRASGILNPPSGYGIQKVVDMLNSDRLRDLSKDIKRASVLMALDVLLASMGVARFRCVVLAGEEPLAALLQVWETRS